MRAQASEKRAARAAAKQQQLDREAAETAALAASGATAAAVGTAATTSGTVAARSATTPGPRVSATDRARAGTRPRRDRKAARVPRTRKARLRLTKVDPWSVMKVAFLLSIAFGIVTVVMVYVVWTSITASGLFDNINRTVGEVVGTPGSAQFRVQDYVTTNKVMGMATLIAGVDVLILTALATLGSFLYNLAAGLLGGFEVTLASDD